MTEKQIIELIENTLQEKIKKDENFIKYSFYEVNVKYHLSKNDIYTFLHFLKIKLNNNNYKVYFEGQKYNYKNKEFVVGKNETIIAIKKV